MAPENEFERKRIVFEKLDISKSPDIEMQFSVIKKRLITLGIYTEQLIFSGFNAKNLSRVMTSGSYRKPKRVGGVRNEIFGSTEQEILDRFPDKRNALQYSFDFDRAGIAVYDKNQLIHGNDPGSYRAKTTFKNALLAVFELVS